MFIKGFDENLQCRGFQFEIGQEYDTGYTDNLELCSGGVFHFCRTLRQVHDFYTVTDNNRFCVVEATGELLEDDDKCGSNKIKIIRELSGDELNQLKGLVNGNTGRFNSGDMNSGDMNSGDRNSGYRNSGYRNSGDRNSGDMNSGYRNSGDRNSGYMNSGDMNSGYRNSGYMNSGYMNSGDMNSGDRNSGYRNSGDFNSCDGSNGVFCTKSPDIKIFNMDSGMTLKEFRNSKYWDSLYSSDFDITYWEDDELKTRSYKDACALWWEGMSGNNKETIKSMPNFNRDIFEEITGIQL